VPRKNLTTNPACEINANDWEGTGGGGRNAVTGFDRNWGYRRTGQTGTVWLSTPKAAAVAGDVCIASVYLKGSASMSGLRTYLIFRNSSGVEISDSGSAFVDLPTAGTVYRLSRTATAPANTATFHIEVWLELPASTDTVDATAALSELGSTLGTYADGETSGWVWDGTQYNSTSSELDPAAIADPPAYFRRVTPGRR